MRKSLLLLATSISIFSYKSFGMLSGAFHYFDKNYVSPQNYITNSKSTELCDELLLLDPEKPNHTLLKLDDEELDKIDQACEREEKVLTWAEKAICKENSFEHLEQIKMAHKAFISPVYQAAVNGFMVAHQKRNQISIEKLKRAQALPLSPFTPVVTTTNTTISTHSSSSTTQPLATLHDLSDQGLEDQILKSNPTYFQKVANYIRKTLSDPVGYLTDQKSGTVADTVLLFNPDLPNAVEFNQSLELHRELVRNAFERQNRCRYQFQFYLRNKNFEGIRILSEKTHRGYRSLLTAVLIRATLKYAETIKKNDSPSPQPMMEFPISDSVLCKCTPSRFLKNCDLCKKNLLDKLNASCTCSPSQLIKNCSKCRDVLKATLHSQPPPVTNNAHLNFENLCSCAQPKPLKSCAECMLKLLQQQNSALSAPVSTTTQAALSSSSAPAAASSSSAATSSATSAAAASSSSSASTYKPLPPVPPKPMPNLDNAANNNSSN